MSSRASMRTFLAGERTTFTNESSKPVEVVLKTGTGTTVRATLPIGASIELAIGQEKATLYVFEPEQTTERMRLVSSRS